MMRRCLIILVSLGMSAGAAAQSALPSLPPGAAPQAAASTTPAVPMTPPPPDSPPAVTLPAASSSPGAPPPEARAPTATAAPAAAAPAPAPAEASSDASKSANGKFEIPGLSFGDQTTSLLFTPSQIASMKQALTAAETHHEDKSAAATPELPTFLAPATTATAVPQEPKAYPAFYLGSIVYHTAGDWTVFLSDRRITPKSNDGDLKVSAIAPDMAQFTWKPPYLRALIERQNSHKFAPSDSLRHKLTARETATIDGKEGYIVFALRPNQTFDASRFKTFEGRIEAAADMPPLFDATAPGQSDSIAGKLGDATNAVLNDMAGAPLASAPATPAPAATPANPATPAANSPINAAVSRMQQLVVPDSTPALPPGAPPATTTPSHP